MGGWNIRSLGIRGSGTYDTYSLTLASESHKGPSSSCLAELAWLDGRWAWLTIVVGVYMGSCDIKLRSIKVLSADNSVVRDLLSRVE